MSDKHPKPSEQPVDRKDDLERDPAIGQSKGLFGGKSGEEAELIEGESTTEGDIENDSGVGDGAGSSLGRTNE